jgi:diguanylate cyclase (GGDEF)-like protein
VALALAALAERQRREESLSGADALTGVANFRHFIDLLEDEIGRCRRYGRSFSIAVMDLDDFAAFNEARGAAAGDTLLVGVAEALRSGLRATDRLGRCGGDEFVVLLPETDVDAATRIIDRLRELFRKTMDAQHWSVSMSIGLVTFAEAPQNVREALRQADELMYAVKQSGKNAVRQAVVGHKRWPHIIR